MPPRSTNKAKATSTQKQVAKTGSQEEPLEEPLTQRELNKIKAAQKREAKQELERAAKKELERGAKKGQEKMLKSQEEPAAASDSRAKSSEAGAAISSPAGTANSSPAAAQGQEGDHPGGATHAADTEAAQHDPHQTPVLVGNSSPKPVLVGNSSPKPQTRVGMQFFPSVLVGNSSKASVAGNTLCAFHFAWKVPTQTILMISCFRISGGAVCRIQESNVFSFSGKPHMFSG
jgi:hypothetical protein